MSQNSGGNKKNDKDHLIQRPLRKYKQDILKKDAELARKLQKEEEERSRQFHNDELLAQQLSDDLNRHSKNGFTKSDGSDDVNDLSQNFARYRGMTEVDALLARQMQRQEEETANARARIQRQQRQHFHDRHGGMSDLPSPEHSESVEHPVQPLVIPPERINVVIPRRGQQGLYLNIPGRRRGGNIQRRHTPFTPPAAQLPDGEDDPDEILMTMGGRMDFLNIMQEPHLLLMALSRTPQFTGNQENIDLNDYEGLWELAERLGEVQNKGMSESEIGNLPTHSYQEGATAADQDTNCQVCLTAFQPGETIRTLPCLHEYHQNCVDEWLKRNSTCPICRQQVQNSSPKS